MTFAWDDRVVGMTDPQTLAARGEHNIFFQTTTPELYACCSGGGQFLIILGTYSYQNTYFALYSHMYFHCIHPYFEIYRIHPQNTTEYTVLSRIHTEYTQNTQRAKPPKSAVRAIHVPSSQQRAKYRSRIRILKEYVFSDRIAIVFRAYCLVFRAYSPT